MTKERPITHCLLNNVITPAMTVPRDGLADHSLHKNATASVSDRPDSMNYYKKFSHMV
jgi:hypothetical protein